MVGDELNRSWVRSRLGTVRARLTLLATAAVAAMLVVASFGLVAVQRSTLTRGIDEALRQRADNIEPGLRRGEAAASLPSEGDREDSFLQLIDRTGKVTAASANVSGRRAVIAPVSAAGFGLRTMRAVLRDHDRFRVLVRSVDVGPSTYTLVVAKNLDDVNESVHVLLSSLALSIPLVVALLGLLVWWLTGRVLRPVESIRAEVASIGGSQLHRRVPTPHSDDEIARLAETMNGMLDRVERATVLQRRFVADASHELRSPLTRIRSDLEVCIAHPDTGDPVGMYRSLLADAVDLERLLEDLLLLARSDAGAVEPEPVLVDLDDLVLGEAARLRDRHQVRVDTNAVTAARVRGDPEQLIRVVRNLADNAERHANSVVTFELCEGGALSELAVSDDGPGIPAEHHATVFERFTRLDEARARHAGGSGLGLAIVHDIVKRHSGSVVITSSDGEGARLLVSLPRAD